MNRFFFLIPALLFLTGCLESTTVIHLNRDGSGTITTTEIVSNYARDIIQGMGTQKGELAESVLALTKIDVKELKQAAGDFGEGVDFVSAKKVETPDGSLGKQVVYHFNDINKVTFDQRTDGRSGEETSQAITFRYTPGQLQILIPQDPANDVESMQKVEQLQQVPPQMRNIVKGMRIQIQLTVEGRLRSTNALFPLLEQNGIHLVDIDVEKLMSSQPALVKFSGTRPSDRKAMQELMKQFPFVHLENQENVTVQF